MNDDHDPDLWLLAGDYLDGALDAAERGRVESDPALMATVDELRALQRELRAAAPAAPGRRESAISAALSEFDSLHGALGERVVRPIESGQRRRPSRYSPERWLAGVAAAVVLLGGLGLVVASGLGGSNDDDEGIAFEAATDTQAAGDDSAADTDELLAADADPGSARSATADAASAAGAAEQTATTAGAETPMSATGVPPVADAAPEPTTAPAATVPASTLSYTFDAEQPIDGVGQLAAAADQLLVREQAGELVNTPETSCGGTDQDQPLRVLSEGLYRTPDAIEREIFVAVDETNGTALALDRASCETVAEAPLP
jgi:hypothetical protein